MKIGPSWNLNALRPVSGSCSRISPPMISAGMRSGVNCILLNESPRRAETDLTSFVFPSPGTPVSIACPPASSATRRSSTASSCPTNTFASSVLSLAIDSEIVLSLSIAGVC